MAKLKFYLSQSGGDNPKTLTSGSLEKGITYEIIDFKVGDNFTISGAPDNNIGTKFISNGIQPIWASSSVIGWNNTPKVVIKKNTIGNVWFERFGSGDYLLKSNGLFDEDRFFINQNRGFSRPYAEDNTYLYGISYVDSSTIRINVCDYSNTVFTDDCFTDCPMTFELTKP